MSDQPTPPAGTGCPAELTNICARRHWSLYWMFIVVAVGLAGSRILTVGMYTDDHSPFFSANDRSRWCTVRSLGDQSKYEIDDVLADAGEIHWSTIDRVRHQGDDGQMHDYSSKPPLLPTLVAGGYRCLKSVTGWAIAKETTPVVRALLLFFNAVPFGVFLWAFAHFINTVPVRDWTRYYMMMVAGMGTFLSTYLVTLNNHLPAAFSVMIGLICLFHITRQSSSHWHFIFGGLFTAFAAANELPALAFLVLATGWALSQEFRKTLTMWIPGVVLVAAAFLGTNFMAHGEWKLAYSHRSDGELLSAVEGEFAAELDAGRLPIELKNAIPFGLEAPTVDRGAWPSTPETIDRWVVRDTLSANQVAIWAERNESATNRRFTIRAWNNWYDYPGSYWLTENEFRSEIDRGQPSRTTYLFHMLLGHHGLISLTPVWLLAIPGLIVLVVSNRLELRWLGGMGLILMLVVIGFYVSRPEMDRNYGGVTSGLRWLFWLIPFLLVGMLPMVDWLGRTHAGRWCCFLLLGASIVSVGMSNGNPWSEPWLYQIWDVFPLPR